MCATGLFFILQRALKWTQSRTANIPDRESTVSVIDSFQPHTKKCLTRGSHLEAAINNIETSVT